MAKGYIVALLKFTNKEQFIENFATKITPLIEAHGGRFLVRTPEAHFTEGRDYSMHVITEFDTFEKARTMIDSDEFRRLQEHRRGNTDTVSSSFMLLEGGDALAT